MSTEIFLTAEQVKNLLNLKSERSVKTLWKSGKIPGIVFNRVWMVSKKQLIEHIEKASKENYREPTNYNDSAFYKWKMKKKTKKVTAMG